MSIDDLTENEAKELLLLITKVFGIGAHTQTPRVILTNIENSVRRAKCLSRIENYMAREQCVDDDDVGGCPMGWGDEPDVYIEKFKKAIEV